MPHSNQRNPTSRDFLLLHAVVIIWGLTAVLGKIIDLPAMVLVAWRTGLAAIGMAVWIARSRHSLSARPPRRPAVHARWLPDWFPLVPLFSWQRIRPGLRRPDRRPPAAFGALCWSPSSSGENASEEWNSPLLVVVLGAAVIGFGNPVSWPCLLTGVAAAAVAALFSYINNALVEDHNRRFITLYEMIGACLFMTSLSFAPANHPIVPHGTEWIWLLVLSQICTVWAFSVYIGLLRRISVYVISLVSNLEPVWGILLRRSHLRRIPETQPLVLARRHHRARRHRQLPRRLQLEKPPPPPAPRTAIAVIPRRGARLAAQETPPPKAHFHFCLPVGGQQMNEHPIDNLPKILSGEVRGITIRDVGCVLLAS